MVAGFAVTVEVAAEGVCPKTDRPGRPASNNKGNHLMAI
jgi:hypothetical protein